MDLEAMVTFTEWHLASHRQPYTKVTLDALDAVIWYIDNRKPYKPVDWS